MRAARIAGRLLTAVVALVAALVPLGEVAQAIPLATWVNCPDTLGSGSVPGVLPAPQQATFDCHVFSYDGTDFHDEGGITVAAENLDGAADPDGGTQDGFADYSAVTDETTGLAHLVVPGPSDVGIADLCVWIDVEADGVYDPTGPSSDGGDCDEGIPVPPPGEWEFWPGNPDTEWVNILWQSPWHDLILDCLDSDGGDHATVPSGFSEAYRCSVTEPTFTTPAPGLFIAAEMISGPNDPGPDAPVDEADDLFPIRLLWTAFEPSPFVGTADMGSIHPGLGQSGTALVCFFIDREADYAFDASGPPSDGGACDTEGVDPDAVTDDPDTDVVELIWEAVDTDGDGVADDGDACPGTPAGDPVDELGCTLDYDSYFKSPIDGSLINVAKLGRVVPIKVEVFANDAEVKSGVAKLFVRKATGDCVGIATDAVEAYAAGSSNTGNDFNWDVTADLWHYNLDTSSAAGFDAGCYVGELYVGNASLDPSTGQVTGGTLAGSFMIKLKS